MNSGRLGPRDVRVTSTTTVHEHRAPTDDSMRLLREVEQKVSDQFAKGLKLNNNTFKCDIYKNYAAGLKSFVCAFDLNGKRYTVSIEERYTNTDLAQEIIKAISEKIAVVLAQSMVDDPESYFVRFLNE